MLGVPCTKLVFAVSIDLATAFAPARLAHRWQSMTIYTRR